MEFQHTAVLAGETISSLNIKPEGIYVDGTLGGGGHAALICSRLNAKGMLIGIDRDVEAIAAASKRLETFRCGKVFVRENFRNVREVLKSLGVAEIDGAILDLGVSSYQLDNAKRGFSYMKDGPLSMRMSAESESGDALTAHQIVNSYAEQDIAEVIYKYGEERWAKRIANRIVSSRDDAEITSTLELADIVKSAIPAAARRDGPHPAKRTFQALRIAVNDELGALRSALTDIIDLLANGGRAAVITFHSLEDRIVKETFLQRENPCECPPDIPECVCGKVSDARRVNKKPIVADADEILVNPRARSAKLRTIEKTR